MSRSKRAARAATASGTRGVSAPSGRGSTDTRDNLVEGTLDRRPKGCRGAESVLIVAETRGGGSHGPPRARPPSTRLARRPRGGVHPPARSPRAPRARGSVGGQAGRRAPAPHFRRALVAAPGDGRARALRPDPAAAVGRRRDVGRGRRLRGPSVQAARPAGAGRRRLPPARVRGLRPAP